MKRTPTTKEIKRAMQQRDSVVMLIRNCPEDIKQALVDEVENTDSNLNDVAVGLLARHYHVAFVRSERRSPIPPTLDSRKLALRLPRRLRTKINVDAASLDMTGPDRLIEVLRESLVAS